MYQFSRAIYRELSPLLKEPPMGSNHDTYQVALLRDCEQAVTRIATDSLHFAHPARSLFCDVRSFFPMSVQPRVLSVIENYIDLAQRYLAANPHEAFSAISNAPPSCRATTRKGTPCMRTPLPRNGYCPSHQHLADTEHGALAA